MVWSNHSIRIVLFQLDQFGTSQAIGICAGLFDRGLDAEERQLLDPRDYAVFLRAR